MPRLRPGAGEGEEMPKEIKFLCRLCGTRHEYRGKWPGLEAPTCCGKKMKRVKNGKGADGELPSNPAKG